MYLWAQVSVYCMMTSSNENIFRVTGDLCEEFTRLRWIPRTKASDAELWYFFDLSLNKRFSRQWWGWWFEMDFIYLPAIIYLTHWGRVKHICISKLTIIGSDNRLSLGRRQAIIWTNAGILLIGHLRTNISEILIAIYAFSFKKVPFNMPSGKCRPFCPGLNVSSGIHDIEVGFRCLTRWAWDR